MFTAFADTAARPGVIFCLHHKIAESEREAADSGTSIRVNPLGQHYLIYLHADGNVRLTFAQPKQCLQLFRDLTAGKSAANEQLCDLFDRETDQGRDMSHYGKLLQKAVASVAETFKRRSATALQSGRGGILPKKSETPSTTEDFDLVTWLVIKDT